MKRVAAKIARVSKPATLRVAIYTRQSVEDAMNPFNSIEAQRESVAAYVASQGERGWRALETRYDDGGYSGSTLKRPALTQLMTDIEAGLIDIVAVYKFDRLSRSQMDFLHTVEHLRQRGVAFVSITQAFDTETITGRAMLGLLSVFAQMERETIAERTRDKMHAARRRGMWTGGPIPLGYDLSKKRLVPSDEEAPQVRTLFAAYAECGSVIATVERANAMGLRSKTWQTAKGKVTTPRPFTKATLRALLTNPVYVGRVRLGAETHGGAHDAIVDEATWDRVQSLLSRGDAHVGRGAAPKHSVLLRGLLLCAACGSAMKTTWTRRGSRTHGSYVCAKATAQGAAACRGSRVPVERIESAVVERIRWIGRDPALVEETVQAARLALDARVPELALAAKRHEQDCARLQRQRANVLEAIAQGGGGSLNGKLEELDAQIASATERVAAAQAERDDLADATIDEAELRRLLTQFDSLWDAMFPNERARVLGLLLDRVTLNGSSGEVAMHFRGAE